MRISDWSSDVCSSDLVALLGLVGHQRVADPRNDIDMVDVEQFDLVEARLVQPFEVFGRKLVARLDIDFAGDRKSGVEGKRGAVRDDLGGRRIRKKKRSDNTRVRQEKNNRKNNK